MRLRSHEKILYISLMFTCPIWYIGWKPLKLSFTRNVAGRLDRGYEQRHVPHFTLHHVDYF